MPNFTVDALRKIMDFPTNVRNISIIAHVDHGKTTLTDSLIAPCGIIPMHAAGDTCLTDTMELEKQKGITIKSTGISLYFDMAGNSLLPSTYQRKDFIVNLVDSPGHVDFSSEVTAALRVTDGALVVVDCVEGVCVQTETVLRQALTEKIRPVLCVNKLDRAFLELQYEAEEMYQKFLRIIEDVNVNISTFGDETLGDISLSPERGNIAFCAGKQAWAFTLNTFAKIYAAKFKLSEAKLVQKLWGDNFWDPEAKQWITQPYSASGKKLSRGFCQFIIEPLKKIFELCKENNKVELEAMMQKVGVTLTKADKDKDTKELLKAVLQKWLPAHEALLEMIVLHLPSPAQAQKYRVEGLYEGPLDDDAAKAIRECDPKGPLMIYISKLVEDKNRFIAFGRVFSGTAKQGAKVRIMDTNFIPGSKDNLAIKSIQRTLIMMGKYTESVDDIPCGNTIGLVGVDDAILKTATITDLESAYPMKQMKFSVSPVVRCAVQPDSPSNLLKLLEGLKRLSQSDQLVVVTHEDTGEHVVAAAGELHLEVCLHQLREMSGIEIKTSEPLVTYKETVTKPSSVVCLAKSANKHNRLYFKAEPLGDELTNAIETGVVTATQDPKTRSKLLTNDFGWEPDGGKKIWCFGPTNSGANIVVDVTKGQQMIHEIRDSVTAAFQWFSETGVLCEESLRGCRFNVLDAHLHADAIHRGAGQIIPTARRAFCASELSAEPRVQEPIFLVEIQCPTGSVVGSIHSVLSKRRGFIIEEIPKAGTNLCNIKAHLPVMESFGFTSDLRAATSGQAFPQLIFDHWALLDESPFQPGKVQDLISKIRTRKGLNPQIPALDYYLDKL